MDKQKLQDSFERVLRLADKIGSDQHVNDAIDLRTCVPVEKAEYEELLAIKNNPLSRSQGRRLAVQGDMEMIKKQELERYRRALWEMWKRLPWNDTATHDCVALIDGFGDSVKAIAALGYLELDRDWSNHYRGPIYRPTQAGISFAASMQEQEREKNG